MPPLIPAGDASTPTRPSPRRSLLAETRGAGGRHRDRGVTLIEAMIVVAIIGILGAVAAPGFTSLLSRHRATAATNDFIHAIATTRTEAMRRSRRVYLAPTGTRWRDGWVIFVDRNDDRRFDPPGLGGAGDELIARHDALPATVSITNPVNPGREPFTDVGSPQRTYLMFDGSGYPRQRNGAFSVGSVLVADRSGAATTLRTICLAAYGRVRVVSDRSTCS